MAAVSIAQPKFNIESIPFALRELPQWVTFELAQNPGKPKPKKLPYDAKASISNPRLASSTDPDTWSTFDKAVAYAKAKKIGIGFALTVENGLVFTDLDDCVADGMIAPWAMEIVASQETYWEYSQSKTGLHSVAWGALPTGRRKKGNVEMYSSGRFVLITGDHVEGTSTTINDCQADIEAIHAACLGKDEAPQAQPKPQAQPLQIDDEAIVQKMFSERYSGHKWQSLFAGNYEGFYGNQSDADLALCGKIAFYAGKNADTVDRIFRRSGLMRPKWDHRHHGDGSTYGEGTVDKAIANCTATYTGLRLGQAQEAKAQPIRIEDEAIPFDEVIAALRWFNFNTDKGTYIPEDRQSATGYRTVKQDTKYLDAVIDKAEAKGRFDNLPLPNSEFAERCNFGSSNTARACKARLMGWFLIPNEEKTGFGVARTFNVNDGLISHVCSTLRAKGSVYTTTARNVEQTSPVSSYSAHKKRDAFAAGNSKTAQTKNLTVKPLVETLLLIIDTIERVGPTTRKELCELTKRKYGSMAQATKRAEELGILDVEQDGNYSPKVYSLAPNAWSIIDSLEPTMKTWCIGNERAERNAERTQDNCNRMLQEADKGLRELNVDTRAAIEKRRDRAARKRERLLPILHPEWTNADTTKWIYTPKPSADPIKVMKRERLHSSARMDLAESRRREQWETNRLLRENIAVFKASNTPKKRWFDNLVVAGFTPREAKRAIKLGEAL